MEHRRRHFGCADKCAPVKEEKSSEESAENFEHDIMMTVVEDLSIRARRAQNRQGR